MCAATSDAFPSQGGAAPGGCPSPEDGTRRWVAATLERLSHSAFRSGFVLSDKDRAYARAKGRATIDRHAHEMLRARVGGADPAKDGRQTPWRGHPVFTAQHATACCCRGCIAKWHGIPKGRALTDGEVDRLAALVMAWIERDLAAHPAVPSAGPAGRPDDAAGESAGNGVAGAATAPSTRKASARRGATRRPSMGTGPIQGTLPV